MASWSGWPFARAYLLLVALAFVIVGLQVFLFHWRAAFRSKTMYGPVLLAPIIVAAALSAAVTRDGLIGWAAVGIFGFGFLEGLIGFVLHLRGITQRIGGFSLRNILTGPPALLPLAYGALALTGGLAIIWKAL